MVDQGFPERPDSARNPMAGSDHGLECLDDVFTIFRSENQWRQQLDRVAGMAGDLTENLMLLKKWNRNQLAEQTLVGGLQKIPRRFQLQRSRRAEFNADHQTLAANIAH